VAVLTTAWEIAQALGLCAVAACLALCVLAVRPRAGASTAFSPRAHELLGWFACAAALLHVAVLVAADPRVVEHLKPTAPRYEYAGMLALLTLLFMSAASAASCRARLWASHRNFQAAHVAAACAVVITLAVHVLATGRYIHGHAHAVAYSLLSAAVLLALLRPRRQRPSARPAAPSAHALVFGRHSRLVLLIALGSLAALLVSLRSGSALAMREPFLRRSEPLVLAFPHDRHRGVNCVQCHHNFTDHSGGESCISCHRSGRADLRVGAEARFHGFCLGCHRDPPPYLGGHGPVEGCSTCHAPS
jgi:ferric reductase like protein/class III cytochrome C family protein